VESNESQAKLSAAFVAAQKEFKSAIKEATNPFYKSKYADLASVWEACHQSLAKHDLAISQSPGKVLDQPLRMELETALVHSSGAYRKSVMEIPLKDLAPQSVGSSITYARRYALAAVLGIVIDEDDANKGSGKKAKAKYAKPAAKVETITKEDAAALRELAIEMDWTDAEREHLLLEYGLDNIMDLEKDQLKMFEAHLKG